MSRALGPLRALWIGLAAASWLSAARVARADDPTKTECASAYEKSQEQRATGKLRGAQEQLSICANKACPAFVQSDCDQWLTEVERELPTVTFSAKDKKGEEVTAVRVTLDGEELVSELDGKSVAIDPGSHKLGFELEGAATVTQEVEIRKGEKDRVISVSFKPRTADAPEASPYGDAPKAEAAKDESPKDEPAGSGPGPLRPYAFVAGGVGAAGVLGFVIFGAMGHSKQSDLNSSCGPTHSCAQSDVDSIKTKYLLADISLGVGIAGLGAGVALFILSQPKGDAAASESATLKHFDIRTRGDGALATFLGRF